MNWRWRGEPGIPKYAELLVDMVGLQLPGFNKSKNADDLATLISEEVDALPERLKQVISLLYGFNETGEAMTLQAAGRRMGVTQERVRQMQYKAMRRLREIIVRGRLLSASYG